MKGSESLERAAAAALIASVGVVAFKLSVAQTFFGIAAILWVVILVRERGRVAAPAFAWALAAYAALTVLSAVVAALRPNVLPEDARASLIDLKQLLMFLMVPMVMRLLRGTRSLLALNVVIAAGAAAAVLGIVQYAVFGYDHLGQRPEGSLSHYMTYSGVIMLVLSATVARLLYFPKQIVWPAVAVPALVVALAATNTRGAWLGAAAAIVLLVGLKRPRLLVFVPAVVIVAALLAPASIQQRARSIFDPNDPSNLDRIQMVAMGVDMIRDHPWSGVGPEMVGRVYGRYLRPSPVHTYNPHLHNVPVQIAAERGLPALAAWIAFVALAAWGLARRLREPAVAGLAAAGIGAIVAMLVAGLFEYNFGDSEFLMLFLALVTLPFAARSTALIRDAAASKARAA